MKVTDIRASCVFLSITMSDNCKRVAWFGGRLRAEFQ
jgi:hypothetical protein